MLKIQYLSEKGCINNEAQKTIRHWSITGLRKDAADIIIEGVNSILLFFSVLYY